MGSSLTLIFPGGGAGGREGGRGPMAAVASGGPAPPSLLVLNLWRLACASGARPGSTTRCHFPPSPKQGAAKERHSKSP